MTRPAAFASAHPNDLRCRRLSLGQAIIWVFGCAAGFAAMLGGAAAADPKIGAAARVVHVVTGAVEATQSPTVLRAGIDVFPNEIIKTGENSAALLVFQDKTELSIGPLSEVVLDRFVFDPDPAKSAVAVSVVTGVVRFSTGLLPKAAYTIRTPAATMTVRGTVMTISVSSEAQPVGSEAQPKVPRPGICRATLLTVTAVGSGTLVRGGALSGTGIVTGTTIVSQVSGRPGGTGTYRVSVPQTVASTTVTEASGGLTATATGSIGATEVACNCTDALARATQVDVETGAAAVSAEGESVLVDAGQSSMVQCGSPPSPPFSSPPLLAAAAQMDALLQQAAVQTNPIPGVSPPPPPGNCVSPSQPGGGC